MSHNFKKGQIVILKENVFGIVTNVNVTERVIWVQWNHYSNAVAYGFPDFKQFILPLAVKMIIDEKEILQYLLKHG